MRRIIVLCIIIAGCATQQEKLTDLEVGMNKNDVRDIMGAPKTSDAYGELEIWHYSEKAKVSSVLRAMSDGMVHRHPDPPKDLPVAFENGLVIGWGEPFVSDRIKKYEIRIR